MKADYVTDKAVCLINKLHGTIIGAKEFSGGWSPERVDAILFNSRASFVIETKISRSDFKADAKKIFRVDGKGVGTYRYYACPEGLIKPDELPAKWGLIWVRAGNARAVMPVGYGGFIKIGEQKHPKYGWSVPISERYGSEEKAEENFCFNTDQKIERDYLYALATRYKTGRFPKNIL